MARRDAQLRVPTPKLMRAAGRILAHEVEVYQSFGFPDAYTDGDLETQCLQYIDDHVDCQVLLRGARVLGHPHSADVRRIEWDGVARPANLRDFRTRVQELAPLVARESPLGQALEHFELTCWSATDVRWERLVTWWALSRQSAEEGLESRLGQALHLLGDMHALRLAAELIRPFFGRDVLVASGHWPPSDRVISMEAVQSAISAHWAGNQRVLCAATGDQLGTVASVRSRAQRAVRFEIASFAEEHRATNCEIGTDQYALTGDGELWRRGDGAWKRCGPVGSVLVAQGPR